MLITSNFSFSQCFQKACFPGASKGVIVWEWVNPFPNKPWFSRVCSASLLKTLWEKDKLLVTSNFSFSHSVFYPFGELSFSFIKFKIVVCKHFQFGRVEKLSFGKGLSDNSTLLDCHFEIIEPYWPLLALFLFLLFYLGVSIRSLFAWWFTFVKAIFYSFPTTIKVSYINSIRSLLNIHSSSGNTITEPGKGS